MKSPVINFNRSAGRISAFALVSYAVDYSFQLVDIFWVSKLGSGAPTAIAIISSVLFLILALNEIIGVGTVALFSQAFGSGDKSKTGEVILQGLLLKGALGMGMALVFLAFLYLGAPRYPVDAHTMTYIHEYGLVICLSLVIVPVYSTMMTAMRAIGDAEKTAAISIVALALNAVLNPLLIFGFEKVPAMGIAGSAWATIIAQVFAIISATYFLVTNPHKIPIFTRRNLAWQLPLYRKLIMIGLPIGGVAILYNLEQAVITAIVATFPQTISDGYSVGARIYGFLFMANFGISAGVSVTVGHHIGRGQINQVQQSLPWFTVLSTLAMTPVSLLVFIYADEVTASFLSNPVSIEAGASYLHFMTIAILLLCVVSSINGAFEGAGRNLPVFAVAVTTYLCVEAPLVAYFLLSPDFLLNELWAAIVFTAFCSAALSTWLFHRRWWQPKY